MLHVPILRAGRVYQSKDTHRLADYATGEPIAELSQANAGLVSRDLLEDAWTGLQEWAVEEIVERMAVAARHFIESELPVGDAGQTPDEFVASTNPATIEFLQASGVETGDVLARKQGG